MSPVLLLSSVLVCRRTWYLQRQPESPIRIWLCQRCSVSKDLDQGRFAHEYRICCLVSKKGPWGLGTWLQSAGSGVWTQAAFLTPGMKPPGKQSCRWGRVICWLKVHCGGETSVSGATERWRGALGLALPHPWHTEPWLSCPGSLDSGPYCRWRSCSSLVASSRPSLTPPSSSLLCFSSSSSSSAHFCSSSSASCRHQRKSPTLPSSGARRRCCSPAHHPKSRSCRDLVTPAAQPSLPSVPLKHLKAAEVNPNGKRAAQPLTQPIVPVKLCQQLNVYCGHSLTAASNTTGMLQASGCHLRSDSLSSTATAWSHPAATK